MFALVKPLIPHRAFRSHLTLANLGIDGDSFKVHLQWQRLEGLWRVWEHTAEWGRLETLIQLTGFTLPSPSPLSFGVMFAALERDYTCYFCCPLWLLAGWSWNVFFPSPEWICLVLYYWLALFSPWPSKMLTNEGSLASGAFTLGNRESFTAFKVNVLIWYFLVFSNHVYPAA